MFSSSSAPWLVSRSTKIAELISGSLSGKTASMTTPWISSIRPTLRSPPFSDACCCSVSFLSLVLASI